MKIPRTGIAISLVLLMALSGCATTPGPYSYDPHPRNEVAGAGVGGALGGILGSQVGEGQGRTAATIGGAIAGAGMGAAVGRSMDTTNRVYRSRAYDRYTYPYDPYYSRRYDPYRY
jgi:surface antigen